MSKHYHDPFRPHAARPVSEDPVPPQGLVQPQVSSDSAPEKQSDGSFDEASEPTNEAVVEETGGDDAEGLLVENEQVVLVPPPQVGPGSSADAWRAYAADATGTSVETWAESTRAAIIEVLRDRGIAVDQSGIEGS